MSDLRIVVEQKCPACRGGGVESHPIYAGLAEATKAWRKDHPRQPDEDAAAYTNREVKFQNDWMGWRGWPGGPDHWPEEETDCARCRGTGRQRFPMTLSDLKSRLDLLG